LGGGGGGYSMSTNIALTPGGTVSLYVGNGGRGGVVGRTLGDSGEDTYFNGTSCASATICARAGKGGSFAGVRGRATEGIGATKYSGGDSLGPVVSSAGVGGGGGAGRANGVDSIDQAGGAGASGAGGAGGVADTAGSNGGEWGGSVGGGGGGGGGSAGLVGKDAGTYGGGGGGGGSSREGGAGAPGIIVITYTSALNITVGTQIKGSLYISGALSKSSGTFVIDHPLDPRNKLLYHSFVESPDAKNLYDGIAVLDESGEATVALPDYFMALNTKFAYQFFPLEEPMPNLYLKSEVQDNKFVLSGGVAGGKVSWQVTGVRNDPYILKNPIVPEVQKGGTAPVGRGSCIFEPLCE
jgi:hypothetical protein